ncbi:MAG: flagellar hook-basal body complex protein FliE [Spirochaetes bacterium]|nr:flagellar hook-basal body complex protein FliE [Spirochaetota bacterium]
MKILSNSDLLGDKITLKTTHSRHLQDKKAIQDKSDPVSGSFAQAFTKALSNVNDLELHAQELTKQMVVDPESVNLHDVQIAAEQAEMAVLFTKSIVDKAIRAYKEITNLR